MTNITTKQMFGSLNSTVFNMKCKLQDLRREGASPDAEPVKMLEFDIAVMELAITRLHELESLTGTLRRLADQFSTEA